jgi:MFS family permease
MTRPSNAPLLALIAAVASASTAYIAVWIVSSLVVVDITGSAVAAGVPSALAALATAFGAVAVANLGIRWTRPRALALGFVAAVAGCGLIFASVSFDSLAWLFVGSLAIGLGNGALQQTRYAAADTVRAERRAWALGLAVWGSTVGAVFGPNLLGLGEGLAEPMGADPLVVSLAIIGGLFALAVGFALLAGRWSERPIAQPRAERAVGWPGGHVMDVLRDARLRPALAALLGAQVAMVLIMTMTPLHIHAAGGDLVFVGLVISAHTLGMFALAPLSARLVIRRGATTVALAGMAVLAVAAVLSAVAPPHGGPLLAIALFLLGYGWNLGFVAGSSMLVEGTPSAAQVQRQGATDFLVFLTGATASITSGALLAVVGFAVMALLGGAFLLVPAAIILRERARAPEPAQA